MVGGLVIGIIPGLGGVAGLTILLPPLLLAFVLGPIIERNVGLTLQLFGWSALQRPGTLIFLGLMTATLVYLAFAQRKDRRITDLRMKDPSGLVGR